MTTTVSRISRSPPQECGTWPDPAEGLCLVHLIGIIRNRALLIVTTWGTRGGDRVIYDIALWVRAVCLIVAPGIPWRSDWRTYFARVGGRTVAALPHLGTGRT